MNKANKHFVLIVCVKIMVMKHWFLAFPRGPGGFRELREAGRNHFHLSWYLIVPGITSYGQKPSWEVTQDTDMNKGFTKGLFTTFLEHFREGFWP